MPPMTKKTSSKPLPKYRRILLKLSGEALGGETQGQGEAAEIHGLH